jgi:hypothetical protein
MYVVEIYSDHLHMANGVQTAAPPTVIFSQGGSIYAGGSISRFNSIYTDPVTELVRDEVGYIYVLIANYLVGYRLVLRICARE